MHTQRYWMTFAKVGAAQFQNRVKNQLIAQPFYYVDGQWLFLMSVHNGATDSTAKEYLELSFRVGGVGGGGQRHRPFRARDDGRRSARRGYRPRLPR